MINEVYAAGFFDGEGCIHIDRTVRVILGGCFKPGFLLMFQTRWGGGLAAMRNSRRNQRNGQRWEVTGPKAIRSLEDVLPHLYEKRDQAELALEYHQERHGLGIRGGKGYSDAQRTQFANFHTKMRGLKLVEHRYL